MEGSVAETVTKNKLGSIQKSEKSTMTDVRTRTFTFSGALAIGRGITVNTRYNINITFLESQLQDPIFADFFAAVENCGALPEQDVFDHSGGEDKSEISPPPSVIYIDSSNEDSMPEEEQDAQGNDDADLGFCGESCAVCGENERDVYLRNCLHTFCSPCMDRMKALKTKLWCPSCRKPFRKYYKLDPEWMPGSPWEKNYCRVCKTRMVNALLSCKHLFCSTCLNELREKNGAPKCPLEHCIVKFRTYKTIFRD